MLIFPSFSFVLLVCTYVCYVLCQFLTPSPQFPNYIHWKFLYDVCNAHFAHILTESFKCYNASDDDGIHLRQKLYTGITLTHVKNVFTSST